RNLGHKSIVRLCHRERAAAQRPGEGRKSGIDLKPSPGASACGCRAALSQRERKLSRRQSVQHPGEGNGSSHVFQPANPCDVSLDTHAEACVRHGSELPQIEIPLEGFTRQIVFFDPKGKQIVARNALSSTDDRSEEHTSELQSPDHLVCRLLLEKKN